MNSVLDMVKSQFDDNEKILLAVSGGVDSMVMLDIFVNVFPTDRLAVAHCNFSLRGEDSISDMNIVERITAKYNVKLYKVVFDTYSEMAGRGKSLQETARELRYEWFDSLCVENEFSRIATAHNANDTVETFFVNCFRGTGVRGLTGIPPVNNNIIRPIMNMSREQILQYAVDNEVEYREDKSNASIKYLRNDIRHSVIPLFMKRNDKFITTMNQNIDRVRESVDFIDYIISDMLSQSCENIDGMISFDPSNILGHKMEGYIMYEMFARYGFSRTSTDGILSSIKKGASGRIFESKTHIAYINRGKVELVELVYEVKNDIVHFTKETRNIESGFCNLLIYDTTDCSSVNTSGGADYAYFDYDKLSENLSLRNWQQGDWFYPFGMNHKKYLSDFFIDKKISVPQKHHIPILCSGSDIIWVVGMRSDNRYRVTPKTERVLIFNCKR